jgi:hypothetical protein
MTPVARVTPAAPLLLTAVSLGDKQADFLLAEYKVLRDEILKRLEMQHQLISFSLVAAGGLFAAGIANWTAVLPLLYPVLALFLANSWNLHDIRITELGTYIRDRIEARLLESGHGWEHLRVAQACPPTSDHHWHSAGTLRTVFAGTQLVAVGLALVMASATPPKERPPVDLGFNVTQGPDIFGIPTTQALLFVRTMKVEAAMIVAGVGLATLTYFLPYLRRKRIEQLRSGYPLAASAAGRAPHPPSRRGSRRPATGAPPPEHDGHVLDLRQAPGRGEAPLTSS